MTKAPFQTVLAWRLCQASRGRILLTHKMNTLIAAVIVEKSLAQLDLPVQSIVYKIY